MGEITGEQIIAKALKTQGVEHGFGVVGIPVGGLAGAMMKEGMTYHGTVSYTHLTLPTKA